MMNDEKNRHIDPEKFRLVQADAVIKDVKFDTKPVGFFKDALMRFSKNKSSVVAAYIILFLLLFAIFAPIFSRYKTSDIDGYYTKVLPKSNLFYSWGWDGNKKYANQTQANYDMYSGIGVEVNSTASNKAYSPITKLIKHHIESQYINGVLTDVDYYDIKLDTYLAVGFQYINLSAYEYAKLQAYQDASNIQVMYPIPQYHSATQTANVWYKTTNDEYIALLQAHNDGTMLGIPVGTAVKDANGNYVPDYIGNDSKTGNNYFSKMHIDGDDGTYTYHKFQKKNSKVYIVNGVVQTTDIENQYYQYAVFNQTGVKVRVLYQEYYRYLKTKCTFNDGETEDSLKAMANTLNKDLTHTEEEWKNLFSKFNFDIDSGFYAEFLFGTNDKGKDIFTLLGSGARLSFILAISVSIINLTIGAFYGAIEGYFGGTTDLIMERVSDILSGVPFIVVATLFNLHLADKVGALPSLLFAFVMTGWIGMASRVRMQFYRFKGQEYILSARTLGAKDFRIMFKHIFPNAIGTIITGSVLSIPGVIFSESSLSYLKIIDLETSNVTSVGTLLSNGSASIKEYPHIIFFPAVFISLLMISFNLFGNGLRDAFNPSLRGADE